MPVFVCHDCAELHARGVKRAGYGGYGTCNCTCPKCGNRGRLVCKRCRGRGKWRLLGLRCRTCRGRKTVACPECKGFLADPSCPLCRGTSCQTCWGSRKVELERTLSSLSPSPRRHVFYPPGIYSGGYERDFPVFTFEAAWRRISALVELSPVVRVRHGVDRECVELEGRRGGVERSVYSIYRFGDDQYGIEKSFAGFESEGSVPVEP